jgi:replication-associated recombination protein RarA
MQDLFASSPAGAPLAERMRPRSIDEVVGQSHLLGPGKPLRVAFESKRPHSMILWGPPGVGKTTLARLMADAFGLDFIAISAVLGGVKDIRDAVERATLNRAQSQRGTVVFVDEVHRFNKAQQDAFLPHVESGLFVFIGATTENPSFEVVGALLSRAAVYVLEPLTRDELEQLIDRACEREPGGLAVEADARTMLVDLADGDARRLLNALEVAASAARDNGMASIGAAFLRESLPATVRRFDKGGENFYDQISALHKSVRGSDPDAALYWMARMFDGGVDPRYVARRVVRMATEDIGRAEPLVGHRAGGRLHGVRAEVERRLQGVRRGARVHREGQLASGADAAAQCADEADEGSRLRRRLPVCARRARRVRRRRDLPAGRHETGALVRADRPRHRAAHPGAARCAAPAGPRKAERSGQCVTLS